MKVGVFYPNNNQEHLAVLTAFATGIKRKGVDVEMIPLELYKPVDMAVVFGVHKKGMPISYPRGRVIREQTAARLPVIVLEKGYVHRREYYAAGFGGLNGRAFFNNEDSPSDRWEQLKVELRPPQLNPKGHFLVCGQVPTDASVQHIDIHKWTENMCKFISSHTKNKVIFRPHPLARHITPEIAGVETSSRTLMEDFENCRAVVTFNSNAAVDAAIEGIPTFAEDKGSMAFSVSANKIAYMQNPVTLKRTQWANDLAYTQWTLQEMANGLPWEHLIRKD